ncbi:unnamed protein product, partial [Effrenium voratum]
TRVTYLDIHARQKAIVPGPGAYRTVRLGDHEPPKEAGSHDKTFSLGSLRDRRVHGCLSKHTERAASFTDLRKVDEKTRILLPSSFQSPGPGAYTAYTSFGSPSGPTRKRFF